VNAGDIAYFDNRMVPLEDARVPITTHAFTYGTGCFEGIRAYWNPELGQLFTFRLGDHMQRLADSARILKLDFDMEPEQLAALALELLARNGFREDAYLRPIVYKSEHTIKVALTGLATSFCMYAIPMGAYLDIDRGLSLTISAWSRIGDNAIPARAKPTGAYVNAAMASDEARQRGVDEAIMLTSDGHVAEASSANVFLVHRGELVTPEAADDILVGVTRDSVLRIAERRGIAVRERRVDRSELFSAEEVFLCGTGVQIAPVTNIDGRQIGSGKPGRVTVELQERYLAIVRGMSDEFPEWRSAVYADGREALGAAE
jgi:branched-chain amino acid aminotransferase